MKWPSLLGMAALSVVTLVAASKTHVASVRDANASLESKPVIMPAMSREPTQASVEEAEPRRIVQPGRVISVPTGCLAVAESYDLVLHFHGAPEAIEGALARAGLESAVAIVNLGIGSGVYEQAFAAPRAFPNFVSEVARTLQKLCPNALEPKRIALTAWSAGYGAIWRIIEKSSNESAVDAVLLADGLHAGFVEPKRARELDALKLEPFSMFAELAKQGQKLFALTHTAIQTIDYGSTTETSNYLLERLGVEAEPANVPGPRPQMRLVSQADSGGVHVLGFSGNDKQAHADQLHAFGDTLLPYLRERWRN